MTRCDPRVPPRAKHSAQIFDCVTVVENYDTVWWLDACRRTYFAPAAGGEGGVTRQKTFLPDGLDITPDGRSQVKYYLSRVKVYEPPPKKRSRAGSDDEEEEEAPRKCVETREPSMFFTADGPSVSKLPPLGVKFLCYTRCRKIGLWQARATAIAALLRGASHPPVPMLNDWLGNHGAALDGLMNEYPDRDAADIEANVGEALLGLECALPRLRHFAEEMKQVREVILNSPAALEVKHFLSNRGEGMNDVALYTRILDNIANKAVREIATYVNRKGGTVCGFLRAAILIERDVRLRSVEDVSVPLPREELQAIQDALSFPFKVVEEDLQPTDRDMCTFRDLPRVIEDSLQAAFELKLNFPHLMAHTPFGVVLFDEQENRWCISKERNRSIVLPQMITSMQHKLRRVGPGGRVISLIGEPKFLASVYDMLPTVLGPVDTVWVEEAQRGSVQRLTFRNGHWDFALGQFVEGRFPELRLLYGVSDTLGEVTEADKKEALSYLLNPFSSEAVGTYFLTSLARAIAGDVVKRGYFVLGDTNSGKSTITNWLSHAFRGTMDVFDASNLCNASGDDRGRALAWLIPLVHCRLVVSNEIDFDGKGGRKLKMNAITYKRLNSGGRDKVVFRKLYNEDALFIPQFGMFVLCNKVPEFTDVDPAVFERTHYMEMDRSGVGPTREITDERLQFRIDPRVEQAMHTSRLINALRWLLFEQYAMLHDGRITHDPPPEVLAFTSDNIQVATAAEAVDKLYEIWPAEERSLFVQRLRPAAAFVADGWSVNVSDVPAALAKYGHHTKASVKKDLEKLGAIYATVTMHGVSRKVWLGLRPRLLPYNPAG